MDEEKQRQLAELVLLQSMYSEEFTWQTPSSPDNDPTTYTDRELSCKIAVSQEYTLELTLPPSYPSTSRPTAYLHCSEKVSTATRKEVRARLASLVHSLPVGSEILDVLLTDLSASLSSLSTSAADPSSPVLPYSSQQNDPTAPPAACSTTVLLMWTHHLLSTTKRKHLVSWASELGLSGFSRPGHPGVILLEGRTEDVLEYEARVKGMRWQALQSRGQIDTPATATGTDGAGKEKWKGERRTLMDAKTGQPLGWSEVQDVSDIVAALRSGGGEEMAKWFLDGMKIGHG